MSPSLAATMRRTTRLMSPRDQIEDARELLRAMAGGMIETVFAPFVGEAETITTEGKVGRRKEGKAKRHKVSRSLREVVKQAHEAQSRTSGAVARLAGRPSKPHTPLGAQYLARRHRSAAGSRGYMLYLPSNRPRRPRGLILMLHGCSQTPDDFAIGTHMNALAEKHDLAIAYPAQVRRNNARSCWNWFRPAHQFRGMGEPSILVSLTRKLMREFRLGRDATFVAGLSAGGSMAAILADLYPDVYSAAGVHSGLARGSASGMISAMSAMRSGGASEGISPADAARSNPVRRIIFQGDADRTVHPSNAAMLVAAAVGSDALPKGIENCSASGREYARSDYAGLDGATLIELWMIEGAGHAWSGGRVAGSYTDSKGPDASAQMIRFFLAKSS